MASEAFNIRRSDLYSDLQVTLRLNFGGEAKVTIQESLVNWKENLVDIIKAKCMNCIDCKIYLYFVDETNVKRSRLVYLTKEMAEARDKSLAGLLALLDLDKIPDVAILFSEKETSAGPEFKPEIEAIAVSNYMELSVNPVEPPTNADPDSRPEQLVLARAFSSELTGVGNRSLADVSKEIDDSFKSYGNIKAGFAAPVVNTCQCSGSGKSKLFVCMLHSRIGFYIVLRDDKESGYPYKNEISEALLACFNGNVSIDPPSSVVNNDASNSQIGHVLKFVLNLVQCTIYKLIELIVNSNLPFDKENVKKQCAVIADFYNDNRNLKYSHLCDDMSKLAAVPKYAPQEKVSKGYVRGSIGWVGKMIKDVLKEPWLVFNIPKTRTSPEYKAAQAIVEALKDHPFLLVLDEAEKLIKVSDKGVVTDNFQVYRRALSYIEKPSRFFCVTLGTKSDILDLHPEVTEDSKRDSKKTALLEPITMRTNYDIFRDEHPFNELKINQETLLNPLTLMYLFSLGHAIWSSVPLEEVLNLAQAKLVNGSER